MALTNSIDYTWIKLLVIFILLFSDGVTSTVGDNMAQSGFLAQFRIM